MHPAPLWFQCSHEFDFGPEKLADYVANVSGWQGVVGSPGLGCAWSSVQQATLSLDLLHVALHAILLASLGAWLHHEYGDVHHYLPH